MKIPITKKGLAEWLKVKALSSSPSNAKIIIMLIIILTGHQWLMPIILATWEAEIRRITVQGQSRKTV
jgi:hypothetical protein